MEHSINNNSKCPAVKRLLREAAEIASTGGGGSEWSATPLENNLFEWHFTIKGAPDTHYHNGIYHGRLLLPVHYPMKPPDIIMTTPNGRFEVNKKICLSISGHHPETWQPSWSIRTALLALIAFMPTPGEGSVGSLDYTPAEKKALAIKSQSFRCPECGLIKDLLPNPGAQTRLDDSGETPAPPKVEPAPVVTAPPTQQSGSDRDALDNVRDVLIFFLMIAVAIFFYRRIDMFHIPLRS